MKSNKMFVALVAMLWSFALSASAQVTNETELKAALAAGGEVVLGADITVTLDGEVVDVESYGSPATIVEGRTLVPLRAIFEALGAETLIYCKTEYDNSEDTLVLP